MVLHLINKGIVMKKSFLIILFSFVMVSAHSERRIDLSQYDHIEKMSASELLQRVPEIDKENIVFDCGGVLLAMGKKFIIDEIGWFSLLCYCIRHLQWPSNLFDRVLDFMDLISPPPSDPEYTFYMKGRLLPKFFYDGMVGRMSYSEIYQIIDAAFENKDYANFFWSDLEKSIIRKIIDGFISPEVLAEKAFKPLTQGIQILKAFYDKKNEDGNRAHKMYLLSNIDNETFSLLREKYKDVFDLFDGIMISAQVESCKPESKIYETFFDKFKLNPKECYFIDDQPENIDGGQKFGMDGVQFIE